MTSENITPKVWKGMDIERYLRDFEGKTLTEYYDIANDKFISLSYHKKVLEEIRIDTANLRFYPNPIVIAWLLDKIDAQLKEAERR